MYVPIPQLCSDVEDELVSYLQRFPLETPDVQEVVTEAAAAAPAAPAPQPSTSGQEPPAKRG